MFTSLSIEPAFSARFSFKLFFKVLLFKLELVFSIFRDFCCCVSVPGAFPPAC